MGKLLGEENMVLLICVHRPIISTENGDLKFSTTGDLVFEAGSSNIRFQSTDGLPMQPPQGFKGEKVNHLQNYWLVSVC